MCIQSDGKFTVDELVRCAQLRLYPIMSPVERSSEGAIPTEIPAPSLSERP